jgi:hypothetical protein
MVAHCHELGHCDVHQSVGALILIEDGLTTVDGVTIAAGILVSVPVGSPRARDHVQGPSEIEFSILLEIASPKGLALECAVNAKCSRALVGLLAWTHLRSRLYWYVCGRFLYISS